MLPSLILTREESPKDRLAKLIDPIGQRLVLRVP